MDFFTCCFTGHRPKGMPFGYDEESRLCGLIKDRIYVEIERHIELGVRRFVSGMAQGADIWCAEAVMDYKARRPEQDIRLTAVIPYAGQSSRWDINYKNRYFSILETADDVVLISKEYISGCMHQRNRYMVDNSTHLIAIYGGGTGGTKYTLDYARKRVLSVTIINPGRL